MTCPDGSTRGPQPLERVVPFPLRLPGSPWWGPALAAAVEAARERQYRFAQPFAAGIEGVVDPDAAPPAGAAAPSPAK